MGRVYDQMAKWSKMKFSENPYYKKHVPDWILKNEQLMKPNTHPKYAHVSRFIADHKQDGYITIKVVNFRGKDVPWEKRETIIFSEIYRRLKEEGTLCPSNFIKQVILDLYAYAREHNEDFDQMFYIGTVARAVRTFASMLREEYLTEIIGELMDEFCKDNGKSYEIRQTTAKEDTSEKTDVCLIYDGEVYRIWSYQTTDDGIDKTSNRVKNACGAGYNILMPFNTEEKEVHLGWWMYNKELVKHILDEFVVNRTFEPMSHAKYKKLVEADKKIITKPAIFKV